MQDVLDSVHWEIVKGKRAIRVRQINNIVRKAIIANGKRTTLPTISDEATYERSNLEEEENSKDDNIPTHVLDLGQKEHLRRLRRKEADLLRRATPARKITHRHFTMIYLGIDAEEFDDVHFDALTELERAAWGAKTRKNQDALDAMQSALLQIRSIQKRMVEEWQVALRDEVDRSMVRLGKDWKRRKRRVLSFPGKEVEVRDTKEMVVKDTTEKVVEDIKKLEGVNPMDTKNGEGLRTRRWLCF